MALSEQRIAEIEKTCFHAVSDISDRDYYGKKDWLVKYAADVADFLAERRDETLPLLRACLRLCDPHSVSERNRLAAQLGERLKQFLTEAGVKL